MFFIVAHAQPAEFVLALGASHMHATLVFLDDNLALWAWFSVEF